MRRFDGWEPAEVHEHTYDGDRLIRTVVTRESEWDDDQRAWMLGLAERESAECKRCGGDLTETLDYGWKWEPQPPLVCMRCVGLHHSEEAHKDSPDRAGLIHLVAKKARPTPKNRKKR